MWTKMRAHCAKHKQCVLSQLSKHVELGTSIMGSMMKIKVIASICSGMTSHDTMILRHLLHQQAERSTSITNTTTNAITSSLLMSTHFLCIDSNAFSARDSTHELPFHPSVVLDEVSGCEIAYHSSSKISRSAT